MAKQIFNTRDNLRNNIVWRYSGRLVYYICWPGIWFILSLPQKRTRVLLISDGHLLLSRDWLGPGKWSLPGGGLHRSENELIGALREMEEETGLVLRAENLTRLGEIKVEDKLISTTLVVFKSEVAKRPKVSIPGIEILDFAWVDGKQLKKMPIDRSTKQILQTFADAINLVH